VLDALQVRLVVVDSMSKDSSGLRKHSLPGIPPSIHKVSRRHSTRLTICAKPACAGQGGPYPGFIGSAVARVGQRTDFALELIGRTGGGLLVFVYYDTPVQIIDEIAKVGNGFVVAGHYDLLTATDSIPTHLNWRNEIPDR
jgi:hypothetical protein